MSRRDDFPSWKNTTLIPLLYLNRLFLSDKFDNLIPTIYFCQSWLNLRNFSNSKLVMIFYHIWRVGKDRLCQEGSTSHLEKIFRWSPLYLNRLFLSDKFNNLIYILFLSKVAQSQILFQMLTQQYFFIIIICMVGKDRYVNKGQLPILKNTSLIPPVFEQTYSITLSTLNNFFSFQF